MARVAIRTLVEAEPPIPNLVQRPRPHKRPVPVLCDVGVAVVAERVAARVLVVPVRQHRLLREAPVLEVFARRDAPLVYRWVWRILRPKEATKPCVE